MTRYRWFADFIALLAGVCYPLAFAPFEWWPISLVSLILFYSLTQTQGLARSLWRSWLFGLGVYGVGTSWVYNSISQFGNATPMLSAALTLLMVMVLALYPLLVTVLSRSLGQGQTKVKQLGLFVASWVLVEWLRSWLFTGFTWLEVGYAWIDTPLAAYAPWLGIHGLTLLVMLTVMATILVMQPIRRGLHWAVVSGVLMLWFGGWWIGKPVDIPKPDTVLNVALVQGNIPQHRKWLPQEREPTLTMYRELTEQLLKSDVVIWPETAVPAYEDQVNDYLEALHHVGQLSTTNILTGIVYRETHSPNYYNAMIALGNVDRGPDTVYTKRHLVPFGEYLPLKWILDPILGFLQIPMSDFSAGPQNDGLIQVGKHKAGASICFEAAFSESIRSALPQADYLINISNDAWFGDSLAPHQHLQMARMRALETGRYLLRATNTGISAVIGPDGKILSKAEQFKREVIAGQIYPLSHQTVFTRFGSYPVLLLAILVLGIGVIQRIRQRG